MNNKDPILIGPSVDIQYSFSHPGDNQEKTIIESLDVGLSGSSANIARAIYNLTELKDNIKLIGLVGNDDGAITHQLQWITQKSNISIIPISILTSTSVSFVPQNLKEDKTIVYGYRGTIIEDKLAEATNQIKALNGTWRIATAVHQGNMEIAKSLHNNMKGYRSISLRPELCQDKENLKQVLSHSDILFLNDHEWNLVQKSFNNTTPEETMKRIHDLGVHIIVVTSGESGGYCSMANQIIFFKSFSYGQSKFTTGSGDWFSGAFIGHCINTNKRGVYEITTDELVQCLTFGAKVAGRKVQMIGAANGPTLEEII